MTPAKYQVAVAETGQDTMMMKHTVNSGKSKHLDIGISGHPDIETNDFSSKLKQSFARSVNDVCFTLYSERGEQYAAGSPVTEYEYIQEAGSWLRLHIVPATWQDAGLRCYLEGGILASPTTSAMATAMTSMMEAHKLSTRSVFTGIHDHSSKGEFTSLDGVPLANMSLEWAEGQPDNAGNAEDCLALTGAGALADVSCGSVLPYFCHKGDPASAAESLTINKCSKDGYEYEPRTSSCYKFHTASTLWYQALHTCHTEGGHLAVINSDMESQVLKEMLEKNYNDITGEFMKDFAFIGIWKMYDSGSGSKWLTVHGESLAEAGFEKWHQGEPNNSGGMEYCGSIVRSSGHLNDVQCNSLQRKYAFICEITV